ncbi:MAG: lipopolysaccharide heptosyltransferase II [Planctomycetota bacterium]
MKHSGDPYTVRVKPPARVLVRAPNWVGDLVMATAAFARMRRAWPDAELTVALRPYLRDLVAGAPWFDRIVEAPKSRGWKLFWEQVGRTRAGAYDLAVVLPNSFETALIPFLARVPERVGYRQGRPGLLTRGPRAVSARPFWRRHGPRRVPEPMPQYYSRLLDSLGVPSADDRPRLCVAPAAAESVQRWLVAKVPGTGPLVLMTAGASFGASKLWPPEHFAAVARALVAKRGARVVVLAGPAEVELAKSIADAAGDGVVAAADPVLRLAELAAICSRADLMVTTDTGPRHVAVAFDVPTICLMGPTDSRYTDYALERQVVIQRRELECVPCQRKVCPLGHHDCMRGILPERVLAAAEQQLDAFPFPGRNECR